MKKLNSLILVFGCFLGFVFTAAAHPPAQADLTYDIEAQQILIEGRHKTDDPDQDYLKKFIFYVNGEEIQTEYNHRRQKSRSVFSFTFPLAAEEGDVIDVKIYSAEGGVRTFTVTAEAPAEDPAEGTLQESSEELSEPKSSKGSGY